MATMLPAKKNTAFTTYVSLRDQADTRLFKANPTLATGDVQVLGLGETSWSNIGTLPSAVPSASKNLKVDLSASEMNFDVVVVQFSDQSGAEWCDLKLVIYTSAINFDDIPTASEINAEVDTALSEYDPPTKAELDSGLAGLNDLTAAEINAEVLDVLNTDTFSELTAIPGATTTLTNMIRLLYLHLRNRVVQSGASQTIYADDNSTPVGSANAWDDGTSAEKGKFS